MRTILKLLLLAVLVAAAWLAWALLYPVHPGGEKFVMLRPGWSTRHIAQELKDQGLIRSQYAFLAWHLWRPGLLKAGEYRFERPVSTIAVHQRLVRGDVFVHTVVVPEGFNMFDVANAIEAAGLGPREEFLKVARDPALISDLDPQARSLEGYLFPDTYKFMRTQTMVDLAAAMVKRFRETARDVGLNGDVHRVVTLASIIEKETGVPEERMLVASVYQNRLAAGIPLQADPSVIYAALVENRYRGSIYRSDLQHNSPYNTYKHAGLPPGPIANPGRASLEAAMRPAQTKYLYFVSDGSGSGRHRFARTLDEHVRNVVAYRRALGNASR